MVSIPEQNSIIEMITNCLLNSNEFIIKSSDKFNIVDNCEPFLRLSIPHINNDSIHEK